VTARTPLPPPDQKLPELAALLGDEARVVLETALGIQLARVRATHVRYEPGRSVTATFKGTTAEAASPVTLAAHAGKGLPTGTAIVGDGDSRIAVWQFPNDPRLPGLPHAIRPELLGNLLSEVGADHRITRIRTRSYRARRRAVIEVTTERHRLFVKVVRPSKIRKLQAAHTTVADHVRVPRSLGYSEELGVAVLEAIPGITVREAIEAGEESLPSGAELTSLLDRIPPLPERRPSLTERLAVHQRFLSTILPEAAPQLARIVEAVEPTPAEPAVAAHNDFHSAQVMVSGGRVSGLVDIDTIGHGSRVDDYAMWLGHLHTLALGGGVQGYATYGARVLAEFESLIGSRQLRPRIAAAVTAFATAPFRSQQPDWPAATIHRLGAAEEWIDR